MTNLLAEVHPITRGLIWILKDTPTADVAIYKEIDYLLNGLLTATLSAGGMKTSQVLTSENFGTPFFVMLTTEVTSKALQNFEDLIKPYLTGESEVLVIDQTASIEKVLSQLHDPLKSKLRLLGK